MTPRATDTRPPFFMIEDAVVEHYGLNPYEGWLYVVIVKHANRKTGEAFPSIATLVRETCMSKSSVIRYIKTLEAKRLIRVDRDENAHGQDREVNHYWLLTATAPVSDSNHPGVSKKSPPVSDVDMNQSVSEPESINQNAHGSKTKKLSQWTRDDYVEFYRTSGLAPSLDGLVEAWGYSARFIDMNKTLCKEFLEIYYELDDAGFSPDNYGSLAAYTNAVLHWKKGRKPSDMLGLVEDWRKSRLSEPTAVHESAESDTGDMDSYVAQQRMSNMEWSGD